MTLKEQVVTEDRVTIRSSHADNNNSPIQVATDTKEVVTLIEDLKVASRISSEINKDRDRTIM